VSCLAWGVVRNCCHAGAELAAEADEWWRSMTELRAIRSLFKIASRLFRRDSRPIAAACLAVCIVEPLWPPGFRGRRFARACLADCPVCVRASVPPGERPASTEPFGPCEHGSAFLDAKAFSAVWAATAWRFRFFLNWQAADGRAERGCIPSTGQSGSRWDFIAAGSQLAATQRFYARPGRWDVTLIPDRSPAPLKLEAAGLAVTFPSLAVPCLGRGACWWSLRHERCPRPAQPRAIEAVAAPGLRIR